MRHSLLTTVVTLLASAAIAGAVAFAVVDRTAARGHLSVRAVTDVEKLRAEVAELREAIAVMKAATSGHSGE